MLRLLLVLWVMALGCGSRPPSPPVGHELAPAEPALVSRTYPVPPQFAALGGRCPPEQDRALCTICSDYGRVVAVVQPGDYLWLDDDPAKIAASGVGEIGMWQWTIAASGGVVRAQVLTCPQCRRPIGWSVMIDVAALEVTEDEVRAELQTALGYPASPLFTTEDDWRAAIPSPPRRGVICPRG